MCAGRKKVAKCFVSLNKVLNFAAANHKCWAVMSARLLRFALAFSHRLVPSSIG